MTLEEKIDCIFDEIRDMQLSAEKAKLYTEGAEHAFCLCFSSRTKEINDYFNKKRSDP